MLLNRNPDAQDRSGVCVCHRPGASSRWRPHFVVRPMCPSKATFAETSYFGCSIFVAVCVEEIYADGKDLFRASKLATIVQLALLTRPAHEMICSHLLIRLRNSQNR